MSCKLSMNNSIKLNSDAQQLPKGSSVDSNVKLAGEEAKDRLYEPKHKKKLVRVLTVVAYVFFVSLAAIMLSLYYVFLWDANPKDNSRSRQQYEAQFTNNLCTNGEKILIDVPYEPRAIPVIEAGMSTTAEPLVDQDADPEQNWAKFDNNYTDTREGLGKDGPLMKKLILNNLLD